MDWIETATLLKRFAPDNYRDISIMVSGIKHELEAAKKQLSNELIERNKSDDYKSLHEIINLQESLAGYIEKLSELSEREVDDQRENKRRGSEIAQHVKRVNYQSEAPIVDTNWYTIDQNEVTFKDIYSLSFRHRVYRVTAWTSCYVTICNLLYKENPTIIERMVYQKEPGIKISKQSKGFLSPKKINGSNLWLDVHGNAEKIKKSIMHLLELYHISFKDVKVYYADKRKKEQEKEYDK